MKSGLQMLAGTTSANGQKLNKKRQNHPYNSKKIDGGSKKALTIILPPWDYFSGGQP
jgi:hypothetical protein